MKRILITLLFAVLIFSPASAALSSERTLNTGASEALDAHGSTFYVDASSGDDQNDGLSPSSAWKSIAKVNAANLSAGDEVLFRRDEMWIGTLSISASGTDDSPLTFGAYGEGLAPIIDGNSSESAIRISGDHIFLHDLTATGNTAFGIFVVSSANYVTLENVTSYDHKYGIGLISSKTSGVGHVVRNCTVYDASRSGIVFDARDVTITNCTIHDNGGGANPGLGHGIYATNGDDAKEGDGCDNATIEHNTIFRTLNQGNGINFKCGRGIIRYNTIYETEGGIHLEDQDPGMPTGTVEIYGNVVYGNNGGIVLYDYNWNDAVKVIVFNNTAYNNNKWDRRDMSPGNLTSRSMLRQVLRSRTTFSTTMLALGVITIATSSAHWLGKAPWIRITIACSRATPSLPSTRARFMTGRGGKRQRAESAIHSWLHRPSLTQPMLTITWLLALPVSTQAPTWV